MKPKILNDYIIFLRNVKNYSENTIINYTKDLLIFFEYIINYWNLPIETKDINVFILMKTKEKDVISFLVYLNYFRNNSSATRQRRLNAIIGFLKWLIYKYPTYNIKMPIRPFWIETTERLPKVLSTNEVKKIKNIFNIKNSRNPKRDNLVLDVFLTTGIRKMELSNINIQDINLKEKYIKIKSKGNIERKVFINEYLKENLINYVKDFTINKPLFINKNGQRLGRRGIELICKKAFKTIDRQEYTVHTLRHTAATLIYQTTNDILIVKEFLGHKSIKSSEIYSHIYNERIKNAVDHNPLNKVA